MHHCLAAVQNKIASTGRGILAMDESNATCGKRLDSIGVENTEPNRRAYRELLLTTPGLGEYISGAILFEETLYQSCKDGTSFVDALNKQGIVPGTFPPSAREWPGLENGQAGLSMVGCSAACHGQQQPAAAFHPPFGAFVSKDLR